MAPRQKRTPKVKTPKEEEPKLEVVKEEVPEEEVVKEEEPKLEVAKEEEPKLEVVKEEDTSDSEEGQGDTNDSEAKHPLDVVFKTFAESDLTNSSKEATSMGLYLIASILAECARDNGNAVVDAIEKNIVETFSDELTPSTLGSPILYWDKQHEAKLAYMGIVSVMINVKAGTITDLSEMSLLSQFKGKYRIIGQKLGYKYFT